MVLTSNQGVLHDVANDTDKKHTLEQRSGRASNELLAGVVHDALERVSVELGAEKLQNGLKGTHFMTKDQS